MDNGKFTPFNKMNGRQNQGRFNSIIYFLQGIATTLLLIALLSTIYFLVIYHIRLVPLTNYAVVFDAGSSHTEMFVYQWPADKSNGLGNTSSVDQFFVCPLNTLIIKDPTQNRNQLALKAISDFQHHLDHLNEYFRPCLQEAIKRIPSNRHKYSPIFLGATAGMRLVRLENVQNSDRILEKIRDIFASSPFEFVVARQVRILSGMEEAIDGWITTNLLLEKFRQKKQVESTMVGVLDLGGASTQVTFTYDPKSLKEPIPTEFTTDLSLFETKYTPFAHSYLCWGKSEAKKRYRARLVNSAINRNRTHSSNTTRLLVRDPCLPSGTNDTETVSSVFRSPCTSNEKTQFHPNIDVTAVVFVGSGNSSKCQRRLKNLIESKRTDHTVNCSHHQQYCGFHQTYKPNLPSTLDFIGLSGYYYVFNNLAFGMKKFARTQMERYQLKDFSNEEIKERLANVCETDYQQFYSQESMTEKNEQHKRGLCFDAWYVWLLLTNGIGFPEEDLGRLTFVNTFPTGKVGWTLGYMINQTNYIPAEYRERLISKGTFIGSLTTSLLIFVIALAFLIVTIWMFQRRTRTPKMNDQLETRA